MSEEEILKLGFEKTDVNDNESQNGYDYYYYQMELIKGLVLYTSASDEIGTDEEWAVYMSEPDCELWNYKLVKELIDVFSKIKNAKREVGISKENG